MISLNSLHKLLKGLAEWCIRFTPFVAIDPPDGLILDVTGCSHLWGGEKEYLTEIIKRLKDFGYNVRAAMADTIGAAWAVARFGKAHLLLKVVSKQQHYFHYHQQRFVLKQKQ